MKLGRVRQSSSSPRARVASGRRRAATVLRLEAHQAARTCKKPNNWYLVDASDAN